MDRINSCQISDRIGAVDRTDAQQTFYNIMPRVRFFASPSKEINEFGRKQLQFIKENTAGQ